MSITIQVIKCANHHCQNSLTEFELSRLSGNSRTISKYNFCQCCRRKIQQIQYIDCKECHKPIPFTGMNSKCNDCKKVKRETYIKKWNKEYSHDDITKLVLQVLVVNKIHCNQGMFVSFTKSNWNTVRKIIQLLRRQGHKISYNKFHNDYTYNGKKV